mgnify:CR=1 FL=1
MSDVSETSEHIQSVLANPNTSDWLKYALLTALEREDKIEAACDAAFLSMVLIQRMRTEEATQ